MIYRSRSLFAAIEHAGGVTLEVAADIYCCRYSAVGVDGVFDGVGGGYGIAGADIGPTIDAVRERTTADAGGVESGVGEAGFEGCARIHMIIKCEPTTIATPTVVIAGNEPLLGQVYCLAGVFQDGGFGLGASSKCPAGAAASLVFDGGVITGIR